MRLRITKPVLAGVLFFLATYYTSYILKPSNLWLLFISSPFNITVEMHPLYNMYAPALFIFIVTFYLKNYNKAFLRKCSLRAVFIIAFVSNYIEEFVSYTRYGAVPLGTSVITLSFIAVFIITLEVFVERKEQYEHIYSSFIFYLITVLVLVLVILVFLTFFTNSSALVHAIGIATFLPIFIAFYERANIRKFARVVEKDAIALERRAV